MEVSVELKGMKELNARLDELGALAQKKLLSRVLRRVAKPIPPIARAIMGRFRKSGALASAVGVYARRTRGQEVAALQVGALKTQRTALFVHNAYYGRRYKGIFYGHLLEFGHRAGKAGRVAARPWLSLTMRSQGPRLAPAFVSEMRRALDAVARRRGQKSADTEGLVPP